MPSLRDLLALDVLAGHSLIAGEAGLEAEVRSMTVIDAPDAVNWVKPQEFVVTSTYPVQDNPEALALLIEQLAARGAAGLGVKLTRFLRDVPDNARARAQELGLPIISLPGALAWSDLIGAVFGSIGTAASEAPLSALYRGFSQHRSRISSGEDLFELVASFVSLPLLLTIEDAAGLGVWARGIDQERADWLAEGLVQRELAPTEAPMPITVDGQALTLVAARGQDGVSGVLAVIDDGRGLAEADLECLRLTLPLLDTLLRHHAETGPTIEHPGLFPDLLDMALAPSARKSLLSAKGLDAKDWHLVVARIFDLGGVDDGRLWLRLRQFCRRHHALLHRPSATELLLAFRGDRNERRNDLHKLRELHQLWQKLALSHPDLRYGLGQAGPGDLSRDAATLRQEALETLKFGGRLDGLNRLHRQEDLAVLRQLADPAVFVRTQQILQPLLAPVLALGPAGEELIETLRVWLAEDENIPRSAERLGLHANSVRHRLERARNLMGLSDFGTAARLRLYVALQLLPLLRDSDAISEPVSRDRTAG